MPFASGLYCSIYDGGTLSQPPVILLHGAGSNRLCWPSVIRRLPGQKMIALDLPGHGRSEGVALQSVTEYADAVLDFMREMGIYKASIIGHSMGSAIALHLARAPPGQGRKIGGHLWRGCLEHSRKYSHGIFQSDDIQRRPGYYLEQDVLFGPSASDSLKKQVLDTLQKHAPGRPVWRLAGLRRI